MKHLLYLLLLVSTISVTEAQNLLVSGVPSSKPDTSYLGDGDVKVRFKSLATKYRITQTDTTVTNGKLQRTYYMSGKLFSELHFHQEPKKDDPKKTTNIRDGIYREWYENGNPQKQVSYSNNKFSGEFITYWKNKQKRRIDNYADGKCLNGICYDSAGIKVAYHLYEQMPVYPGGEKELLNFISHHHRYPVIAQENGVQGTVIVRFVITKEGKVDKIAIVRSLSIETDREASRVVSIMPDWMPGKQEGEPVNVYYTLPIKYRIENDSPRQMQPFGAQNVGTFNNTSN